MKNNKGISILALIITIIVIIIITSITVYNGIDSLESARQKNAQDTLKIICNSLTKDEEFLTYDASGDAILSENDFKYLDLENYYDEGIIFTVNKKETVENNQKSITYKLTSEEIQTGKKYEHVYSYDLKNELTNYNVVFDPEAGVNMPIVLKDMKPLLMDKTTLVEDIYLDHWYSYSKKTPHFARVEYNGKIYVWIPRFAYKIQNFYQDKTYPEVPNTAIDILFINGTTNYMTNGERIPVDYIVHPAFSVGTKEYAGLWVEEEASHPIVNLNSSSIIQTVKATEGKVNYHLHLMTNMEAGAAMYLTFAFDCPYEVDLTMNEYVAANIGGAGIFDSEFVTIYEDESQNNILRGDAIRETPWKRVLGEYPTSSEPYIIRKFASSMFDFINTNGNEDASSRSVIAIN